MERKIVSILRFILCPILLILVVVYVIVFYIFKYVKIKTQKKFNNVKIVCVGNHTLGGTGKTTVVKKLAEELKNKGKKIGIVTRGYKRKDKKNSILLNPDTKFDPAYVQYTGDEPFMLFSSLNIPIAVSSSRINAIKKLCEENKVDIIISDDGYQNFSFYKDISILIINLYEISRKPQVLFPLGNLREKLSSALKRTQYVILNHSRYVDYITVSKIMHKIKQINRDIKIIKSYYKIKNFVHLYTQKIYLPNEFLLMNFNIMVSCGLGKPELFIRSLELIGLEVKHKFFYPDHYWYKTQDLKRWRKFGNYPVVVTYKDAVKLFPLINKLEKMYIDKIYYCNVELEIEEGKDIWEELIHSLSSS